MPWLTTSSTSLGVLGSLSAFFWDSRLFSSDVWAWVMNALRVGLPIALALLIIIAARTAKAGRRVPDHWQKRIAIGFTLIAFGTYFDFFNPNARYKDFYHRHALFHDYLGAKYAREIGYERLYECAAVAQVELGRRAAVAQSQMRDLRDNFIKPATETSVLTHPELCKRHFTPARWQAWRNDVEWFYEASAGSYWDNMQQDHGFNYSPVWTLTAKPFIALAPVGNAGFKWLASIDVILHAAIVLLIGWAFGWRVMAVATVFWGCNAVGNFYWSGGAFLRQDWLFLVVASVCLARKRHYVMAGAALTWAALAHVFPVYLLVGWAIVIALYALKQIHRRISAGPQARPGSRSAHRSGSPRIFDDRRPSLELLHWSHRRLLAGCVIAAAILVPASIVVTEPAAWDEFRTRYALQHDTPLTNQMGLQTVLVHDWAGRMRFTRDDNLDDPFRTWRQGCLDRFAERRWAFYGIVGIVGLWTLWALRRTKSLWAAIPLGLPLFFCVENTVCYFYSVYVVAAVLVALRKELAPVVLAVSSASQVLLITYYWVDDKFTAEAWLYFVFSLLILYAFSRPFSLARLKAWWHDRPEPRGGGGRVLTQIPAK